jgi:Spy/CpxP family protein refolding chaperone
LKKSEGSGENMMLKHCSLALLLAAVALTAMPFAAAQDSGSNDQQSTTAGAPPEHGHGGHFDPTKRTEMLTKRLKLTSDQQPKVLDILKSAQSQMQSLRSDSSLSQDDRRSKMMDIHKTSDDQIRALLDANQQKKFDAMQSEHGQWRGHHQGGQAPSAPDSSQPK